MRFSDIRWPVSKLSRLCNKECLRGPGKMIGRFRWIGRWNEVDLFVDFNLYFCIESVPELIITCISISRTFCAYSCFRNCEFSLTVYGKFFPATVTFQISVHYGQMIFLYRTSESILRYTHTHTHTHVQSLDTMFSKSRCDILVLFFFLKIKTYVYQARLKLAISPRMTLNSCSSVFIS